MIKKSFAMTGYITTPLFQTLKLSKEREDKKHKKFKVDAKIWMGKDK